MCGTPGRFFLSSKNISFPLHLKTCILVGITYCLLSARYPVTHTLRFLLATSLNVIAVLTLEAQNPFRSPTNLGKEVGILGPSCLADDYSGDIDPLFRGILTPPSTGVY